MDEDQIQQLRYLFSRYVNNLSTKAEYDAFLQIINGAESDPELKNLLNELWAALEEKNEQQAKPNRLFIYRLIPYGIAAAALIGVAVTYLVLQQKPTTDKTLAEQIAPVQKGVTLKLQNGSIIQLSKNYKGTITGTNASQQDSLLAYNSQVDQPAEEENTLTNNGNERFNVTLSDGTTAILDIGSSLTYPTKFSSTREVTLTGQGYFKVKHQSSKFLVHTQNETTEDIGTEFNIEAYDRPTTTLVEGSIKVNNKTLKPGQQIEDGNIKPADLETNLAWLQDKYIFSNEPLENIMKWVSRIYGVKVVYQDEALKHITFGGSFNRKKKLASVLNFFRSTGGVDFKVENQTVTVFKTKPNK